MKTQATSSAMPFAKTIASLLSFALLLSLCLPAPAFAATVAAASSDLSLSRYVDIAPIYDVSLESHSGSLHRLSQDDLESIESRLVYGLEHRVGNEDATTCLVYTRDLHIDLSLGDDAAVWSSRREFNELIAKHPTLHDAYAVAWELVKTDAYGRQYLNAVHSSFDDEDNSDAAFFEAFDSVLASIPQGADAIEKAKVCFDYLATTCTYRNETWASVCAGTGYDDLTAATAYGSIVEHRAICTGYAIGLAMLLNATGIEATVVSTPEHSWTKACIEGRWYNFDACWAAVGNGIVDYTWFMKSDSFIMNYQAGDTSHGTYVGGDRFDAVDVSYDNRDWTARQESGEDAGSGAEAATGDVTSVESSPVHDVPVVEAPAQGVAEIPAHDVPVAAAAVSDASSIEVAAYRDSAIKTVQVEAAPAASPQTASLAANVSSAAKKANPASVRVSNSTVKRSVLKKKAVAVTPLKVSGSSKSAVSYAKYSGSPALKINAKTGKVTIKKHTSAGVYRMNVLVRVNGGAKYSSKSMFANVVVKVRNK